MIILAFFILGVLMSTENDMTDAIDRPVSNTRKVQRRVAAILALGVLVAYLYSTIFGVENMNAEIGIALLGAAGSFFGIASWQNVRDVDAQVDVENVRREHREQERWVDMENVRRGYWEDKEWVDVENVRREYWENEE